MSAILAPAHVMDQMTDFCTVCGVSMMAIVDDRALPYCHQPAGEIATQHIMSRLFFAPVLETVLRAMGE